MEKRHLKTILIILLFLVIGTKTALSQSALPLEAYGVWDRNNGENFNPQESNYDYLLGINASQKWSDVQPDYLGNRDSSNFNWQHLQKTLDRAAVRDQYVYIGYNFGPDAPEWIYDNGVPKVYTDNISHLNKFPYYPYYLDPDYKRYYYKFIRKLGEFINSQPEHKFNRIAFVQVKTGCTGDEAAYKGEPDSAKYDLPKTGQKWIDFRKATFDSFRVAFNTGEKQIPLLFNDLDPAKNVQAWEWITSTIGEGFGIKEGATVRGHHLNGERTDVVEQWKTYLVDPAEGQALFARSEMDQTWKKPLYQINVELGFYWGAINGLNRGLSVWDVTKSALDMAYNNPSVQNTFRFFNKYADQIYPETSKRAFIVLHEGLDASDTEKFTESVYGTANKNNEQRYTAICSDSIYASRGAKMADPYAATRGQVYQRRAQTGYNDAGWEIWPDNYTRFIRQIDPEKESIGLFRIGGPIDENSPIYSRFARAFENSSGKNAMYFNLHDDFFSSSADTVTMTVIYYDKNPGSTWELKYDAGAGNFKTAYSVTCTGSKTWKTRAVVVNDAVMMHHGPNGSDFALVNTDSLDDIFHLIEIEKGSSPETTSVGEGKKNIVKDFALNQNYPNPFNPVTNIRFTLPNAGNVRLCVYNMLGEEVKTLVDVHKTAGVYSVDWDGTNSAGRKIASGVYFYKLQMGSSVQVKKMLLMK